MNYEESSAKIRQQLADYSNTNADDWFLCLKARFGMAVVFNALRDIKGYGDVITTPYTCITSINPILVSGLKPVYADIDQNFLSTLSVKETLTTAKTHAVVMQHTLGMVGDKSKLASFAKKHNLFSEKFVNFNHEFEIFFDHGFSSVRAPCDKPRLL